ncbi:hypothetical protein FYK55_13400 [Roseiconus nitratireducens]|uniref:Uncharacterized protein n=1 Tax=Roseiconus nitratireducens TaxID=2605748 RepID=A0A5M6DBK9_9BACT|nr:hypothetical protein [Roseiconus nitratireducens]KAA5542535.1 hypothetical protein FYK55_13400 [Roseiconus nitratireducens]
MSVNPYQPPRTELRDRSASAESWHGRFDCQYCGATQSYLRQYLTSPFGRCKKCCRRLKLSASLPQRLLRGVSAVLLFGLAVTFPQAPLVGKCVIGALMMLPPDFAMGWYWSRLHRRARAPEIGIGRLLR